MPDSIAPGTPSAPESIIRASEDGRYGLRLPAQVLAKLLQECMENGENETGGIITGYYSSDLITAHITDVTVAPPDSFGTLTRFYRGIRGLKSLLQALWNRNGRYYLGEWHSHPYASPQPSEHDIDQMARIARDGQYACSHPVLIIVGGDPDTGWELFTGMYSGPSNQMLLLIEQAQNCTT